MSGRGLGLNRAKVRARVGYGRALRAPVLQACATTARRVLLRLQVLLWLQTCSTRCSASSYRATGVRYYGCRPAATRCRAFRRRLQEHGCAAGVAQPNVVAAGIDVGRAAAHASPPPPPSSSLLSPARLLCVAAHCRQLRRRTQRRGQASGTEDEARRLGACGHDGTASVVARRSPTRCLPIPSADRRFDHTARSLGGLNKRTFRAVFFRKVVSVFATTRETSLTFRSIATVGPSAHGRSGARMAERSLEAIAYS